MRILPPNVQAAFDSNNYTPIIRAWWVHESNLIAPITLLEFHKHHNRATIKFHFTTSTIYNIKLERGILLNGQEITISSAPYIINNLTLQKEIATAECTILENGPRYIPGDTTYLALLNTICLDTPPNIIPPSATWPLYQSYPTGTTITARNIDEILAQLRKKYFLFCDDGDNSSLNWFCATERAAATPLYTIPTTSTDTIGFRTEYRRLVSIDENNTTHYSGSPTAPLHHLGYLHSSAQHPNTPDYGNALLDTVVIVPANLKYQSGDPVRFDFNPFITCCLDVTEIFEPHSPIPWRMKLRPLAWYANTTAGSLPQPTAQIGNYIPLNTSTFNNILSSTDDHIQAAIETLDNHTHPYQPANPHLSTIANLSPANNDILIYTSQWTNQPLSHIANNLNITSGTWTPTLTNASNITASTAYKCTYQRIGNIVTFAGLVTINATGPGTAILKLSLPIPSNFTDTNDASGNITSPGILPGSIIPDTSLKTLDFRINATGPGTVYYRFVGQYIIK